MRLETNFFSTRGLRGRHLPLATGQKNRGRDLEEHRTKTVLGLDIPVDVFFIWGCFALRVCF